MPVQELENFRKKYPDYNDIDDATLAAKLASKYPDAYGDLPGKVAPQQPQQATPQPQAPEWAGRNPNLYGAAGAARETLGPILEALGMAGGGIAGAASTPEAFGAGAIPGAGAGYAGAKRVLNLADLALGNKAAPTLSQEAVQTAKDVGTGATMEAGGQVVGKIISPVISALGNLGKQIIGATTGAGPGMAESAVKAGESQGFRSPVKLIQDVSNAKFTNPSEFTDAMRGKVSGEDIVDSTKLALNSLKEQRGAAYAKELESVSANKQALDTTPITNKLNSLLKQYRITKADPATMIETGKEYNLNSSVFGKSAQRDVQEMIDLVTNWRDKTPLGLDTLKRRLGDFYSDSSQARQFVSSLYQEVNQTLTKSVPNYSTMTKGYQEATGLIKDVESGLMLKKNMTSDQTLRRLTSSMRENFEMRRDLVNVLGEKTGQNLNDQIAGYSASQAIPRGLVGKLASGGMGMLTYVNPKFWPILASSSPRVMGEFLNVYGKGLVEAKAMSPAVYKSMSFELGKALEDKNKSFSMEDVARINGGQNGQDKATQIKDFMFGGGK